MTVTNVILLKALDRKQFKSIKKIQADLKLLGVSLSPKTIYAKLESLANKNLCHKEWQEGKKIYGLSRLGEWELDLYKTQLLT